MPSTCFRSQVPTKILIGKARPGDWAPGPCPEVGEQAACESGREIRDFLTGANIVFVTAGMGGGTGTGSAHYVADIAKEPDPRPHHRCGHPAVQGRGTRADGERTGRPEQLTAVCDTTIVILNDKLLELVPKLPVDAAFKVADEVLMQTIKGLTEIITKPGLVNLDYADIQTIMNEGGVAFVGIGESDADDDRVEAAVHEALNSPCWARWT